MRLNKRLTKVVALERVCRVATTGRSRVPHVVPVCYENGTRFKRLRAIYEKYLQYPEESALTKGSVIVEITPRHVYSWGFE